MRVAEDSDNALILFNKLTEIKVHCRDQLKVSTCTYCQFDGNCTGKKGIHATLGRLEKYVRQD